MIDRRALPSGDYGVADDAGEIVAVVERKTLADLSKRLVDGSLAFAMAELATVDRAAIVVEDRWADVFRLEHVAPGSSPICSRPCRSGTRRSRSSFARLAPSPRSGPTASSAPPVRSRRRGGDRGRRAVTDIVSTVALHPWNTDFTWDDRTGPFSTLTAEQVAQFDTLGFVVVPTCSTPTSSPRP